MINFVEGVICNFPFLKKNAAQPLLFLVFIIIYVFSDPHEFSRTRIYLYMHLFPFFYYFIQVKYKI